MTKVELQFYETVIRELPKITKLLKTIVDNGEIQIHWHKNFEEPDLEAKNEIYNDMKADYDKEQYNRNREFKNQIK